MSESDFRLEKDSMGELKVPNYARWAAQTQRAVNNFPVSGLKVPRAFIRALGLIKGAAATVNGKLNLLDADAVSAIEQAAAAVADGEHDEHFPIDIFQTGSGTSSNMNANEVIANLASELATSSIHPNDHVNMGQSSNDVIPTAIHVSAAIQIRQGLLPALEHLEQIIGERSKALEDTIKTGRTHLRDAMPVSLGQELSGWGQQITNAKERIAGTLDRLQRLAQGGTAVGTGINAHPEFGAKFAIALNDQTNMNFVTSPNYFESLSCQDTAVEVSGQLKALAVALMKIANDLRWMNSGPLAGIGEIALPSLQPGSSIMPGKINPVIPEATCMVAAQVIGNDATITVAGQAGNFQLNVMLPVVAYNLLQSIEVLSNISRLLADDAIAGFTVNQNNLTDALERNPILVTALNPVIGYNKGAETAKKAYKEGRPILDVALETTGLSREELERLLDPAALTKGGIQK